MTSSISGSTAKAKASTIASNVEAMKNGTPVITFDSGGSPEILTKETGFVIKRGDYDELANAVLSLNKNSDREQKCINRSSCFSDSKMLKEYLSIYESFEK